MNVRELMDMLSDCDPTSQVVIPVGSSSYDDIRSLNTILIESKPFADHDEGWYIQCYSNVPHGRGTTAVCIDA